ncbi:MAG TPA: DNA-3-methyladenine glycosylase [Bacillota bacterium]|nr:DNA-3-methyladenine glycosylase [Bacillota bacterium]
MPRPLPFSFYLQDTVSLARALLGQVLCRRTAEGLTAGIIVETEAYLSQDDPACHASRGMTRRNAPMFGPPGRAYVYFIYGNHYCFNVTSGAEGVGEAVLVRALQPLEGVELMLRRRGEAVNLVDLANGPGKLCRALSIDTALNGHDLRKDPLWIAAGRLAHFEVVSAPRIGITQATEKLLRFYIKDNNYVSRRASIERNPGTGD